VQICIDSTTIPLADGRPSMAEIIQAGNKCTKPALMIRTPYPRLQVLAENDALRLARAGWVVVVQSVRGRYGSQGEFTPFAQERDDGVAAIRWCCAQPWSNGRIVVAGKSYEGFAAWMCVGEEIKGLVGVAPWLTASAARDWFYEGDAFRHAFAQSWGLSLAYTTERACISAGGVIRELSRDLKSLYEKPPAASPLARVTPFYTSWLSSGDDDYWSNCACNIAASADRVPAYILTGWHDIFCEGAISDYERRASPGDRLIIGPWSHDSVGSRIVGGVDYDVYATWTEFDVPSDLLDWMTECVRGGMPPGRATIFFTGANCWTSWPRWPPQSAPWRALLINRPRASTAASLVLIASPRSAADSDQVNVPCDRVVATPGGRLHDPLLPRSGGYRMNTLMNDAACATYVSEPLLSDLCVAGQLRLRLAVLSSHSAIDLCAWLGELDAGGLCTGVCSSIARLRKTDEYIMKVDFCLGNAAHFFHAGNRLVLTLSTSSFPQYDVVPFRNIEPVIIANADREGNELLLPIISPEQFTNQVVSFG
jgi:uncharacterized protein